MTNKSMDQSTPAPQRTSSSISRKLIPGLLFGFLVFAALILVGDIRQIGNEVRSFPWQIMPAVLGLTLWNYILRFIKWHYFLRQVGVPHLPIVESARLFVAGFPLAVTPGKVGETLKGVWLNQLTGFPTAKGVSVVLAERISDGLAMLVLSAVGVIAYQRYWPAFAIVLGLLMGAVIISQIRPLAKYILAWGPRLPLVKRFASSINDFYEGTFTLFRPLTAFVSVSLGSVSWLAEGVGFYLILVGLGVTPGIGTLSIAIFVLSFSTVIGAISALPGGLLATDASIIGMLVLLLDMDANTAAAATLLIRFATLWFGVGIGFITWFFSRDLLTMRINREIPQD
ncbi:MAG: lysylphosphatidylglycerol synthase transmembrane domain-containing protein [Anaerolineales bacterium]